MNTEGLQPSLCYRMKGWSGQDSVLPLSDPVLSFEALKAWAMLYMLFWPSCLWATGLQIAYLGCGKLAPYVAKVPKCFLHSFQRFSWNISIFPMGYSAHMNDTVQFRTERWRVFYHAKRSGRSWMWHTFIISGLISIPAKVCRLVEAESCSQFATIQDETGGYPMCLLNFKHEGDENSSETWTWLNPLNVWMKSQVTYLCWFLPQKDLFFLTLWVVSVSLNACLPFLCVIKCLLVASFNPWWIYPFSERALRNGGQLKFSEC